MIRFYRLKENWFYIDCLGLVKIIEVWIEGVNVNDLQNIQKITI
jgi:hypothetical protein